MDKITITRTNGLVTTYDYELEIKSCNRTANHIINELKKYAENQTIKCVQILEYTGVWLYMGIAEVGVTNQLFVIRYEWGA